MQNSLCISSRVRLARNICGYPFCNKLSDPQALGIIDEVRGALGNDYSYINFSHLSNEKKNVFVEKHLVSHEFINTERPRALFLNTERNVSVMVGEEDHIRIQAFENGTNLEAALEEAMKTDDRLSRNIDFMFDERFGFLTQCPTNTGTGMRASVMMFLPTLLTQSNISQISSQLASQGLTIRGTFGEGTFASANLYQISNNVTLGLNEKEIAKKVTDAVNELEKAELDVQKRTVQRDHDAYKNKCMRALGILRSSFMITSAEAVELLSAVMLGSSAGLLKCEKSIRELYEIMLSSLPCSLSESASTPLTSSRERDIYRAEFLKSLLA